MSGGEFFVGNIVDVFVVFEAVGYFGGGGDASGPADVESLVGDVTYLDSCEFDITWRR